VAITFVSQTTATVNGQALTPTLPTHTTDDIILAFPGWECNTDTGTEITESANGGFTRAFNIEHLTGRDRRTALFWKRATSASETDPQFDLDSAGAQEGSVTLIVLRGCIASGSPLDVTYVEGTHTSDTDNTINVTPQGITTNTNNAWVVLLYYATHDEITVAGAPTNYDLRSSNVSNNQNSAIATREITSAGLESPGAWTHSGSVTNTDTTSHTIAIKPASGTGSPALYYQNLMRRRN